MSFSCRRKKNQSRREVENIPQRKKFLIVCEGEKTEPNYFKTFHRSNLVVETIGAAGNTIGLVEVALERKDESDYDEVWCVFDKDSFPAADFDNAILKAKSRGIKSAYTNEAFELWYILHYTFHTSGTSRADYKATLNRHMQKDYKKNDPNMREFLGEKIHVAISNAKKLRKNYGRYIPSSTNPVTTVDVLVEALLNNSAP